LALKTASDFSVWRNTAPRAPRTPHAPHYWQTRTAGNWTFRPFVSSPRWTYSTLHQHFLHISCLFS